MLGDNYMNINKNLVSLFFAFIALSISFPSISQEESVNEELKSSIIKQINENKSNSEKMRVIYNTGKPLNITNYFTGIKEKLHRPGDLTEEEGAQYVPQTEEYIDLYLEYLYEGLLPIEAIVKTHISPKSMEVLNQYKLKELNSKE